MAKDSRVNAPAGRPSTAADLRRPGLYQKGSIGALANEFGEEGVEGKKSPNKICHGNLHPDSIIAAVSIPVTETITRRVKPDDSKTPSNA
jgi:hypothetical protein